MSEQISVPETVVLQLKKMIFLRKELAPNQKLPGEIELTEHFNVSRNSIREAIKILCSEGILRVERGVGTFVTEDPYTSEKALSFMRIEDKHKLELDWYRLRIVLEPEIAAQAAAHGTREEIEKIRYWEQKCLKKIKNHEDYAVEDSKFHVAISQASHNLVIAQIMPELSKSIEEAIALANIRSAKITAENAKFYHDKIAFHIESRSPESASAVMHAHLQVGFEQLTRDLKLESGK